MEKLKQEYLFQNGIKTLHTKQETLSLEEQYVAKKNITSSEASPDSSDSENWQKIEPQV